MILIVPSLPIQLAIGLLAHFELLPLIGRSLLTQRLVHFRALLLDLPIAAQLALFSLAQFLQLLLEPRPK